MGHMTSTKNQDINKEFQVSLFLKYLHSFSWEYSFYQRELTIICDFKYLPRVKNIESLSLSLVLVFFTIYKFTPNESVVLFLFYLFIYSSAFIVVSGREAKSSLVNL